MSGGSYNYLYLKDDAGLEDNPDLERMATRLDRLGYPILADETRHPSSRRIVVVWEAIEKYDSSDWGWNRVEDAIASYNQPPLPISASGSIYREPSFFETILEWFRG